MKNIHNMRGMFSQKGGMGVFVLAFAAFLLLVLTGCPNPLRTQDATGGTVSLTIERLNMGRAIQPDTGLGDFTRFEVDFTRGGVTVPALVSGLGTENITATATLPTGGEAWNFAVRAFMPGPDEGDDVLAAEASGIVDGQNIVVTLVPVVGGYGSFAWSLLLPMHTGVDRGTISVLELGDGGNFIGVDADGNIIDESYVVAGTSANLAAENAWEGILSEQLAAGAYVALIRLYYEDALVATSSMALHIYAGMTSLWKHAFFASVEISFRTGDGEFTGTGLGFRRVIIPMGGTIIPPEDVERVGYRLGGWNTTFAGTGTWLSQYTLHFEDVLYYAIWEQAAFDVTGEWDFYPGTPATVVGAFYEWHLEGEIIQAMRAAEPGSQLRLHFDATGTTVGTNRSGWAIGNIGIPPDIIALTGPHGAELVYDIRVEADWLLEMLGEGGERLTVRTHGGNNDMLTKVYLLEPIEPRDNVPARPSAPPPPAETNRAPDPEGGYLVGSINIDTSTGNIATGHGHIVGGELALITDTMAAANAEGRDILLRVYVRNLTMPGATPSWGVGQLNGISLLDGAGYFPVHNHDRNNDISQADIERVLAVNANQIFVNVYNGHAVTLVELWTIPRPVPMTIYLGDTPVGGRCHHGRSVNVTMIDDGTGFQFAGTGGGHRGKFAWFGLDFGDYNLSDFMEVRFDFQVLSDDGTRRLALLARNTPFPNASLPVHQTTNNSGAGYLAGFQVTNPMPTSINPREPAEVVLTIDPTYAMTLDGSRRLYLSIYEHTPATANIRVSNIRFIERPPGCLVCGHDPCADCDAVITEVRALIEGTTFAISPAATATTLAQARTAVTAAINALDLRQVSFTVVDGVLVPATELAAGSFTFTVDLRRGDGAPQATRELTLAIPAIVSLISTMGEFVAFDHVGLGVSRPAWLDDAIVGGGTVLVRDHNSPFVEGVLLEARSFGWTDMVTPPTWVGHNGNPALRVVAGSNNHGVWINVTEIPDGAQMVITGRGGANATAVALNTSGGNVAGNLHPSPVPVAAGETFTITASLEWLDALRDARTGPGDPLNRSQVRLIGTPHSTTSPPVIYVDRITIAPVREPLEATLGDFISVPAGFTPAWLNDPIVGGDIVSLPEAGNIAVLGQPLHARNWDELRHALPRWVANNGRPELRFYGRTNNAGLWINVNEVPEGAELIVQARAGANTNQARLNVSGAQAGEPDVRITGLTLGQTFTLTATAEHVAAVRARPVETARELRVVTMPHTTTAADYPVLYITGITFALADEPGNGNGNGELLWSLATANLPDVAALPFASTGPAAAGDIFGRSSSAPVRLEGGVLTMTGRTGGSDGITFWPDEIPEVDLAANIYNVIIAGRLVNPGGGAIAGLARIDGRTPNVGSVSPDLAPDAATGAFTLSTPIPNTARPWDGIGLRICTNGAGSGMDIVIDTITVTRVGPRP